MYGEVTTGRVTSASNNAQGVGSFAEQAPPGITPLTQAIGDRTLLALDHARSIRQALLQLRDRLLGSAPVNEGRTADPGKPIGSFADNYEALSQELLEVLSEAHMLAGVLGARL